MKTRWSFRFLAASIGLLSFVALPGRARAQDANAISSRTAEVGGVTLHYLTAGHGPALILLHGYTQTSRMWRPATRREIHGYRTRPARHWRLVDSQGRHGHEDGSDPDSCARQVAACRQSQSCRP